MGKERMAKCPHCRQLNKIPYTRNPRQVWLALLFVVGLVLLPLLIWTLFSRGHNAWLYWRDDDYQHTSAVHVPMLHGYGKTITPNYPLEASTYYSGGAGLSSTAYDYAIFLQMILNGGKYNGKQIIAPRTAEIMTSPQLDFKFNGQDDFSLGFMITSEKSANLNFRNKGSFSWGGYYGTSYWADPKDKLVVLIMTQHNPNSHGELSGIIERIIW